MNTSEPLRAPAGARGWTPADGWLYDGDELPRQVEGAGDMVLVVSDDGMVRGVQPHAVAPLAAVLRVDADLAEVVARLDDLGDRLVGVDTAEATDVNELRARVTALVRRVDRLEGRAP